MITLASFLAGKLDPNLLSGGVPSLPPDAPSLGSLLERRRLNAPGFRDLYGFPSEPTPTPYYPDRQSLGDMLEGRFPFAGAFGTAASKLALTGYGGAAHSPEGVGAYPSAYFTPGTSRPAPSLADALGALNAGGSAHGAISSAAPLSRDVGRYGLTDYEQGRAFPFASPSSGQDWRSDQPPRFLLASADAGSDATDAGANASFDPAAPLQVGEAAGTARSGTGNIGGNAGGMPADPYGPGARPTRLESAVRGAGQGLTLGLGDRLVGLGAASQAVPFDSRLLSLLRLGAEAVAPSIFGHAATDIYDTTVTGEKAANALAE
jgi:hypothetical protein